DRSCRRFALSAACDHRPLRRATRVEFGEQREFTCASRRRILTRAVGRIAKHRDFVAYRIEEPGYIEAETRVCQFAVRARESRLTVRIDNEPMLAASFFHRLPTH